MLSTFGILCNRVERALWQGNQHCNIIYNTLFRTATMLLQCDQYCRIYSILSQYSQHYWIYNRLYSFTVEPALLDLQQIVFFYNTVNVAGYATIFPPSWQKQICIELQDLQPVFHSTFGFKTSLTASCPRRGTGGDLATLSPPEWLLH